MNRVTDTTIAELTKKAEELERYGKQWQEQAESAEGTAEMHRQSAEDCLQQAADLRTLLAIATGEEPPAQRPAPVALQAHILRIGARMCQAHPGLPPLQWLVSDLVGAEEVALYGSTVLSRDPRGAVDAWAQALGVEPTASPAPQGRVNYTAEIRVHGVTVRVTASLPADVLAPAAVTDGTEGGEQR